MTSLPFPYFLEQVPVDATNKRSALAAVGRCRINPATMPKSGNDDNYQAICAKNREQALVDDETPGPDKDQNKKLRKKYMKQGVAMAEEYLNQTLQLDVSIVDVEIVVDAKDIMETDGCLAACLLDAGCCGIVMDGTQLESLDAAKIPRERMVAHFSDELTATREAIQAALAFAGTISVAVATLDTIDQVLQAVPEKKDKVEFQLAKEITSEIDKMISMVAEISKKCKDGKGSIALIDPSASQLGLSYAACMKTDRDDGLFTTVVCTRNGEALGLVYSSKVSEFYFFFHDILHVARY